MLNGIAPIMIFQFAKTAVTTNDTIASVPVIANAILKAKQLLPAIPLYLDEKLTGLAIVSESKNVDINTDTVALTDSTGDMINNQNALSSTVTITMKAKRGTIGLAILSALIDVLFKKVTAKEYTITYLHGAVVIFGALLHSFEINENDDTELSEIKLVIIDPGKAKLTSIIPNTGVSLQTPVAGVHP